MTSICGLVGLGVICLSGSSSLSSEPADGITVVGMSAKAVDGITPIIKANMQVLKTPFFFMKITTPIYR